LAGAGALLFAQVAAGFAVAAPPQAGGEARRMQQLGMDCRECHTCEAPRPGAPCLKTCPRSLAAQNSVKHSVAEAPDAMELASLEDQYEPVHFDHKLHASMSEMNLGCGTCHHFSPPGHIPPCQACHGAEANPSNLRQPSLKGAYHRQCLNCHKEWSHDTDCSVCHLPKAKSASARAPGAKTAAAPGAAAHDPTDIMGIPHPRLTAPERRVYHTPYEAGATVTFYHNEHVELFGLRCVDCHRNESCSYCHDLKKPASLKKSMEQVHAICNDCHRDDKCAKCHDSVERPAFSHASTGWSVGRFHAKLECRACHPTGKRISKVGKSCNACHGGWNQSNFRHAVTGLQLDEVHIEADCADCHLERRYNDRPTCAGCHDDERDYKQTPPGKFIKLAQR
jgi:hypothetical protein